jgi:hypothetical protein
MYPYEAAQIGDYPADPTGYGPTGTGGAPTPGEMRQQKMNKFHMDRASAAMQYFDPYVQAAVEAAMSKLHKTNDPAKLRRAAFSTAGGQSAMDMAMGARRAGLLGKGDPINYAHDVMRGVATGGFSVRMEQRDADGNVTATGSNQEVSGAGALTEQVALNYQQGLARDLYGTGTPDPSKLYGFRMDEASGVFQKIASRTGLGQAASIIHGADTQTRIDAARDSAAHPLIKERLSKLRASTDEELDAEIAKEDDDAMKAEMTKIRKSTSAVRVNSEGRKAIADTTKEVIKGMAALSDMYTELNAPQLNAMLESISGKRITNRTQAKQATALVNEMRNAAEASGVDPRAFMDYAQQRQMTLQGKVADATGLDSRSDAEIKAITAQVSNQTLLDAQYASKGQQNTATRAAQLGVEGVVSRSTESIAADKEQGRVEFMQTHKAVAAAQGALTNDSLVGADKEKAQQLLAEYDQINNDSSLSQQERTQALADKNAQLQQFLGEKWGGEFGWESAEAGPVIAEALKNAYTGENYEINERRAKTRRQGDLNRSTMNSALMQQKESFGITDAQQADQFSKTTIMNVGADGLVDLMGIAKDTGKTAQARRDEQMAMLTNVAGMSQEEATAYLNHVTNADGTLRDEKAFSTLVKNTALTDREGGSTYTENKQSEQYMQNFSQNGTRKRVTDKDGKVSVNSIVTALATDQVDNIDNPETMGLAVQAMAEEGYNVTVDEVDADGKVVQDIDANGKVIGNRKINLANEFANGVDISQGFNEKSMAEFARLNGGKDIGLAQALGLKDNAELAERTKNDPKLRARALRMLTTDKRFEQFNISGDAYSAAGLSIATDRGLNTAKFSSKQIGDGLKTAAAVRELVPGLTADEQSIWEKRAMKGEELGLVGDGNLLDAAEEWKGKKENGKKDADGNWTHTGKLKGASRFGTTADSILQADGAKMEGYVKANRGNKLAEEFEKQADTYSKMYREGVTHVEDTNPATGKTETLDIKKEIADLRAAAEKLRMESGGQSIGQMTVDVLKVERYEEVKKS